MSTAFGSLRVRLDPWPTDYGSETPGFDFEGVILEGSTIEMEVIPAPSTAALGALPLAVAALRRRRR